MLSERAVSSSRRNACDDEPARLLARRHEMAKQDDIGGLIETWMQGQQKIWNDWMGAVGKGGSPDQMMQTWQQGLERWRESMDSTLDAQSRAMKAWVERAGKSGAESQQARRWAEEGAQLIEQWTRAQRGLWEQWFALMGSFAEGGAAGSGTEPFRQYMAGWEQVSKQMRVLQEQWAASLASGPQDGGTQGGARQGGGRQGGARQGGGTKK
jgi:hypothetical protein